jgi:hypothetical protein
MKAQYRITEDDYAKAARYEALRYSANVACNSVRPFMMANLPALRSRGAGNLRSIDLRR